MNTNVQLHTSSDYKEYHCDVEFYIFEDENVYIAYSPSLELVTSGKTYNEAIHNFYECFQLHIDYCVEHNTLLTDLMEHGWKVKGTTLVPPTFTTLFKRCEMKELFNRPLNFERIVTPSKIRAVAV